LTRIAAPPNRRGHGRIPRLREAGGRAAGARRRASRDRGQGELDRHRTEVAKLEAKSHALLQTTYARLTPWQKTQVARHPERPHFRDYVAGFVEDFMPLAGDRGFADDQAIIGGSAASAGGARW
jgi:acetyl-CoA carboxylase alpha subunit